MPISRRRLANATVGFFKTGSPDGCCIQAPGRCLLPSPTPTHVNASPMHAWSYGRLRRRYSYSYCNANSDGHSDRNANNMLQLLPQLHLRPQ